MKRSGERSEQARPGLSALGVVLFVACFALYGNTIGNRYSIDDEVVTHGHPLSSQGLAGLAEIFTTSLLDVGGEQSEYRPLGLATFALEHELVGENPHVGHLINVLLYATTALLLFAFLRALLGPESTALAFVTTASFSAHPMHTEVVASLKSRDELLALLFGLTSSWLFLRYAATDHLRYAAGGIVTLVLGFMSKLSAVLFVALIPLSIAYRHPARAGAALRLGVILLASLAVSVAVVISFVLRFLPTATYAENPLVGETDWLVRLGTGFDCLLFYLRKLLVPYPFAFYYGTGTIEVASIFSAPAALSLVIHAGLALYVLARARAMNVAAFGIAWYLVAIFPYSNLLTLTKGTVAERWTYVGSIGFALVVAYALFRIGRLDPNGAPKNDGSRQHRTVAGALLLGILLAYGGITWDRNRDWKDAFTLYEADIGRVQESAMALQIYSRQLRREFASRPASGERSEKLHKAIDLSLRATRVYPGYASAYAHVGAIYLYDLGDPAAERAFLERASELATRYTRGG